GGRGGGWGGPREGRGEGGGGAGGEAGRWRRPADRPRVAGGDRGGARRVVDVELRGHGVGAVDHEIEVGEQRGRARLEADGGGLDPETRMSRPEVLGGGLDLHPPDVGVAVEPLP